MDNALIVVGHVDIVIIFETCTCAFRSTHKKYYMGNNSSENFHNDVCNNILYISRTKLVHLAKKQMFIMVRYLFMPRHHNRVP